MNEQVQDVMLDIYQSISNNDASKITSTSFCNTCIDAFTSGNTISFPAIQEALAKIIVENGWKESYIKLFSPEIAAQRKVSLELEKWVMVSRNVRYKGERPSFLPVFEEEKYISIFDKNGTEYPMYGFMLNDIEIGLLDDGYEFVRYNDTKCNELIYYKKPKGRK